MPLLPRAKKSFKVHFQVRKCQPQAFTSTYNRLQSGCGCEDTCENIVMIQMTTRVRRCWRSVYVQQRCDGLRSRAGRAAATCLDGSHWGRGSQANINNVVTDFFFFWALLLFSLVSAWLAELPVCGGQDIRKLWLQPPDCKLVRSMPCQSQQLATLRRCCVLDPSITNTTIDPDGGRRTMVAGKVLRQYRSTTVAASSRRCWRPQSFNPVSFNSN